MITACLTLGGFHLLHRHHVYVYDNSSPITVWVRNSPASEPGSESPVTGFQDKFHSNPDPDTQEERRRRAELA